MKLDKKEPPRQYKTGAGREVTISDCGSVILEPDEQVTFVTQNGAEYDFSRKSWGYYAAPSLNRRLKKFGLRAVLVKSEDDVFYVMVVEKGKEREFQGYLRIEGHRIVTWLDSDEALKDVDRSLNSRQ